MNVLKILKFKGVGYVISDKMKPDENPKIKESIKIAAKRLQNPAYLNFWTSKFLSSDSRAPQFEQYLAFIGFSTPQFGQLILFLLKLRN